MTKKNLEERLRAHPGLYERINKLLGVVANAVGDGASWIVEQVECCFGTQGSYLIDFYHVSHYLAAAAAAIAPNKERQWRQRQQRLLQTNRLKTVLKTLATHQEVSLKAVAEAPVVT